MVVESQADYINRKMTECQALIQEATEAGAIMNPVITDGFDQQGAHIAINIRINEPKLNEYRKIKKQN